ncbi:hypothetical protein DENSPDRAFT_859066 [Dentipellis sp. KUC8613]|nr:hypothetical protein DENSPDRAFT_859066 [Dentipellis sp. KUC8613]
MSGGLQSLRLYSGYVGLVTLATLSVYGGAFGSLPKPKRTGDAKGKDGESDDEDEDSELLQRLASEDVWLFPVLGSITLFGLYMAMKYFGKEVINLLMGWYITLAAIASVSKTFLTIVKRVVGKERWNSFHQTKVAISNTGSKDVTKFSWRTPTPYLLPLGAIPSILWATNKSLKKSALVNDIIGLSFAHDSISLLRLDSFKSGTILLSGLLLYDVWWVFGTEVMVHVATNLDLPVKLLWPKALDITGSKGYMMLGLGDIVIPGTYVALALRYDYYRFQKDQANNTFKKPYFYAVLFSYFAGLATTMIVMHVFQAAQPALVYLSPACIMAFLLTAITRGELYEAWTWSDDPPKPQDQNGAKDEAKDKGKEKTPPPSSSGEAPTESN